MPTHRSADYKLAAVRYFQHHDNLAETCREQGVVSWKLYDKGGMTSDRMVDFLQEILRNRKNTVVLMDNAPHILPNV